jgi:hypothetical protein
MKNKQVTAKQVPVTNGDAIVAALDCRITGTE